MLDRRFKCNKYSTQKSSIQSYVDLHGGPEFLIHWKYASITNMLLVCFTFSLAIPFLYVIALIAYIIHYTVERLCLAYYYKQPPLYDDLMSKSTLKVFKLAVPLHLFFGFWAITHP